MQTDGKILSINQNITNNKLDVLIELNSNDPVQLQKLAKKEKLSISIKNYTKKRSLDANAYFHYLNREIAAALHISQDRCKNMLLSRYGQYEYIDGQIPTILVKSVYNEDMSEKSDIHLKPIRREFIDNVEFTRYAILRGSHTYTTKEMSVLIDGTVEEAKALEIDTITTTELREMKERWNID